MMIFLKFDKAWSTENVCIEAKCRFLGHFGEDWLSSDLYYEGKKLNLGLCFDLLMNQLFLS